MIEQNHNVKTAVEARYATMGEKKSKCKNCGGGQICEHGRINFICRECGDLPYANITDKDVNVKYVILFYTRLIYKSSYRSNYEINRHKKQIVY